MQAAPWASPASKHVGQRARQSARPRGPIPILVACFIVFGLLNIPVECAVAAGPHSMFLAPDTVATLQQGTLHGSVLATHASHDRARDDAGHPGVATTSQADGDMAMPMAGTPDAPVSQPHPSMPTPAGFASDAVPMRVFARPVAGPRNLGPAQYVTTWTAPLIEHETDGPEPPPPNLV